MNALESAKRTIQTEVDGLQELSKTLDDNFTQSVDMIHAMKQDSRGRLIIAGIGKSGHIGNKIVATLASTGTPSFFVHPGEASHGDMGMITKDDIVLMISNSGENPELSDLMTYTRRFKIPLIAITSNSNSTLARHSDALLLMPQMPEACPNGLAPTTSTTMTLAIGDALAVALLEKMNLTPEQFGVFHPGGKLGKRLIPVNEVMHQKEDLPLVNTQATMDQVIVLLTEHNLGCVLISDDGQTVSGIVTDGDLKRHMDNDLLQKPVLDVMSKNPKTISEEALAVEALNVMTKTPNQYITSLIAVDEKGALSGLIRLQDCLQLGIA
ncbi:MAG: KpsF/GutQ family sugar-phosphate isomerase [Alphaproteobacteria bacterium]|nr:KpsF/GutQ family sugar-phosphate isomerase [Alphaproteobacteria bacterium]